MAAGSAVENIILGCLTTRPMSGYEIKQLISLSTSLFYNASYGSIYPILKKQEEAGLVSVEELVEGGRFKKIYQLTEKGRNTFLQWLEEPPQPITIKNDMLVRLFFFNNVTREKQVEITEIYLDHLKDFRQRLDDIAPAAASYSDIYKDYTLRWGKDFYQFLILWYENLLSDLQKPEP
ncbi:transcriptional regulator, padr family [hydrocarbon metagenome]|uniref:Transcriptional regulator, padr family n=1 Tax=hydrocarbon metagenome TaxID=938273 RepID=A0A0W8E581_9ZZZZ